MPSNRTLKIITFVLAFICAVLVVANVWVATADAWKCEYHPEQPTCTTTTAPTTVPVTTVPETTVPDTTTTTSTTVPVTTTTVPTELYPPTSIVREPTPQRLAG